MKHSFTGLFLLAVLPLTALAEGDPLDGVWTAQYATRDGRTRQAELRLSAGKGTWKTFAYTAAEKRDSCLSRPFPALLTRHDDKTFALEVQRSAELAGCADLHIKGQLSGAEAVNVLEGDRPMTLTRQR